MTLLAVMAGGALGVALRAAITMPIPAGAHPLVVPGVTLVINVLGSFGLGWLVGRLGASRPLLRAFLGTGAMGGFTTYSAFSVQVTSVATAAPVIGLLLGVLAIFGGLAAAVAGLAAGRRAGGRGGVEPAELAE